MLEGIGNFTRGLHPLVGEGGAQRRMKGCVRGREAKLAEPTLTWIATRSDLSHKGRGASSLRR